MQPELVAGSEYRCFGGTVGYYRHLSAVTGTGMRFGAFMPAQAGQGRVPCLYYLAGLESNEETFLVKAGAIGAAAAHGLALIAPDTSPRGAGVPGEDDDWTLGTGAGFYVDAIAEPWAANYRMYSYVTRELPAVVEAHFPVLPGRRGICGHSMGGHGALVIALREPERWRSMSAFAPIANPMAVPWGENAFSHYLGPDRQVWAGYDASVLMARHPYPREILVDQGLGDRFLNSQLRPESLEAAAKAGGQSLTLRRHEGYDHTYWFIQSFVADHIDWHARKLQDGP